MTLADSGTGGLFDLTGQVAVITGSSRGIGRAIAERMAEQGARVVISSRKADACEAVARAINARHGEPRAIALPANLSQKESLQRLIDGALARWGRIDTLVCNAASNPCYGPMAGIGDEAFRKILDNNVLANHWLIGMAAPAMRERGEGAVIIVSSIGGLKGSAVIGAYNISKAADMQLARNMAVELGPEGIRVNCIAPGLIHQVPGLNSPKRPEGFAHKLFRRKEGDGFARLPYRALRGPQQPRDRPQRRRFTCTIGAQTRPPHAYTDARKIPRMTATTP